MLTHTHKSFYAVQLVTVKDLASTDRMPLSLAYMDFQFCPVSPSQEDVGGQGEKTQRASYNRR